MNPEKLITRVLQDYSLGRLKSFEALSQGFANENYKIVTEKGTFLFRIQRQQSVDDIEKEHHMLRVLKIIGFPAAFPVPDKAGKTVQLIDGLPVLLYDFIPGETPVLNAETVAEVASALALLHSVDVSAIPQKRNGIRPEKVVNLMKRFPATGHPIQDILDRFTKQWQRVEPLLHQELPVGLIHADLFPDNTLFEGNKLKAIIDFEQFCTDQLLFDVAMCINGFCFVDIRLDDYLLEVFLQAYGQRRPLEAAEKELLPHYIRWTALGMVSWHLRYHLLFQPDARQEKRVRELLDRAEQLGL